MQTKLQLLLLPSLILAANIDIQVGAGGLLFTPSKVKANVGDNLIFHFVNPGHSVAEAVFSTPCAYKSNGLFSGIIPVGNSQVSFSYTVQDLNAIWIYCSQAKHCQDGMSMVVNEPSDESLETFQSVAQTISSGSTATAVAGGTLSTGAAGTGSASASASSSTSSASASSSAASASSSTSSGAGSATTPATGTSSGSQSGTTTSAATSTSSKAAAVQHVGDVAAAIGAAALAVLL